MEGEAAGHAAEVAATQEVDGEAAGVSAVQHLAPASGVASKATSSVIAPRRLLGKGVL